MRNRPFLRMFCGFAYGALCLMFLGLAIGAGCTSDNGPGDGGVTPDPNQPASCTPGAYCLRVDNQQVRACDVVLSGPAGQQVKSIGFGASVIGQSLQKGQKIGFSFVLRKNETMKEAAAVLQVPEADKGADIKWKIAKTRCFDAKGNAIDAPKVTFAKE